MDSSLGARPKIYKDEDIEYRSSTNIDQLPDEVLEYIFKLISPYADYTACYRVSRRWREICIQACGSRLLSFNNQLSQGELCWTSVHADDNPGSISKRYSHCSVYNAPSQSMFVFGGCSSTSSTFNDLLQFNLSTRTWNRPRAIGTYPSPKALSTLVDGGNNLVLFGGWTHPSPYPLHQTWKLFTELHFFDIIDNRWSHIVGAPGAAWPPPSAGHSATIHRDKMVIFGGLQKEREIGFFNSSNNLWVFSITEKVWILQPVQGDVRPTGRYGQSQVYIDETHLLILGGCVGTTNSELTDVWLLEMGESGWRWIQLRVEGTEHRGKDIWRHPACRASNDRVVVLGKSKVLTKKSNHSLQVGSLKLSVPAPHHVTRNAIGSVPMSSRNSRYNNSSSSEENEPWEGQYGRSPSREVDGARGQDGAGPSGGLEHRMDGLERELSKVPVKPRQKMLENRQRQLASLNRMEERIRNSRVSISPKPPPATSPPVLCPNHRMALNVLDISQAICHHTVTWLPPSPLIPGSDVPQECTLYSLVKGRTELIMFGGLKKDISLGNIRDVSQSSVSNSTHILYPYISKI